MKRKVNKSKKIAKRFSFCFMAESNIGTKKINLSKLIAINYRILTFYII